MSNIHRDIDINELLRLADEYCDHCIESTKEVVSGSGKLVQQRERHLPYIRYFLYHWLRREHKQFYMLKKSQFYEALSDNSHPLSDTIKNIDESFKALATDIVANEGKGIFYAKNKLGMTDKQQVDGSMTFKADFGTE